MHHIQSPGAPLWATEYDALLPRFQDMPLRAIEKR